MIRKQTIDLSEKSPDRTLFGTFYIFNSSIWTCLKAEEHLFYIIGKLIWPARHSFRLSYAVIIIMFSLFVSIKLPKRHVFNYIRCPTWAPVQGMISNLYLWVVRIWKFMVSKLSKLKGYLYNSMHWLFLFYIHLIWTMWFEIIDKKLIILIDSNSLRDLNKHCVVVLKVQIEVIEMPSAQKQPLIILTFCKNIIDDRWSLKFYVISSTSNQVILC